MAKASEGRSPDPPMFGDHLARLRKAAGLSLRQVEEATNKEVSNAYLSQLENGKITKPSPNVLHAIAEVYKTSYEDLMERAGYFTSSATAARRAQVPTFAVGDLTAEEEAALLEYLNFYRQQHNKK